MNGKAGMALGIGAGAIVVGGLLYFALAPVEDAERRAEVRAERQNSRQISDGKAVKTSGLVDESGVDNEKSARAARPKIRMRVAKDWFADLPSSKDRAIAKRIQDAQDADDREAVLKAAEDARLSTNAEVRQAAVEALSLQGEAAIKVLMNFVGEEDKDVADSAYRAWDDAVDGLEGDFQKRDAVREVLHYVNDEEHIKSAVSKIESFDQVCAIRELANLAKEGGKAAAAAKESYESVTGEPFESWAAAELKAISIDRDNKAATESVDFDGQ